jgi:hypothetical protein
LTLFSFVVLLVLAGVAAPSPALADDHAPVITSVRLSQPVRIGSPVWTDVQGSDATEPGSGITYLELDWACLGADGRQLAAIRTITGGVGGEVASEWPLGPWAASGHWALQEAVVGDRAGNLTTYHRDGTVSESSKAAAPSPIDLSPGDFDVTNPNQDVGASVVDDITPLSTTVTAGQPLSLLARLRDDRSQVASIGVSYIGPSGSRFEVGSGTNLGAAGFASGVVPLGAESGVWHATDINLIDFAGNWIDYTPKGIGFSNPDGVAPFVTPPAIDWTKLDVTVQSDGGPVDAEPPVLQSAALVTPATVRMGDSVEIDFDATDVSGVVGFTFYFADSGGHMVSVDAFCGRDQAIIALPLGLDAGPLTITSASGSDTKGNNITYLPDGTTRDSLGVIGHHDLDLHALDMTVVAGQGSVTVPRNTTDCRPFSTVTTATPASARKGTTVPITGTVTVAGQPVADGAIAIFRTDYRSHARLVRLVRTNGYGQYEGTMVLDAPTTVRVEFLGRTGAPGALGPNRVIRWARGISLSGAATTSSSYASFTTRVVPCVAGSRILLQYRTPPGSFNTLAIGTTDSQGYAHFRIAVPVGQRTYRASAQLSPVWAIATSPTLTQRRTR